MPDAKELADRVAEILRPSLEKATAETIKVTVNGKIDGIKHDIADVKDDMRQHNERHEADMVLVKDHMKTVEPYLQGAAGMKLLGNGIKYFAGVAVAWVALKAFFTGNPL